MNTLTPSQNNVATLLREHISLFSSFKYAYLFGSVLIPGAINNDIDILLIYVDYSDTLLKDLKLISDTLEEKLGLCIDLTVLSEQEESETNFLSKLKNQYLRIK